MEDSSPPPSTSEALNQLEGNFLVIPYPIQGHINPMIKLSEYIANHGSKVALVLTEHTYKGVQNKVKHWTEGEGRRNLNIVVVPDGLEPEDERKNGSKVAESMLKVMPEHVRTLIAKSSQQTGKNCRISCLIADLIFRWAPEIAEETGIKLAWFWTSSPGALVSTLRIPELIQSGLIDQEGNPVKKDEIEILPDMPSMDIGELPWLHGNKMVLSKSLFKIFSATEEIMRDADWLLCNWFSELCPSATVFSPNVVPVGPLLTDHAQLSGTLDLEDMTCFSWLDQQPPKSVIYVAFGSLVTLTQNQLDELALGLELSGRRFLWTVRAGLARDSDQVRFPDGFEERIAGFGMIVKWSSQDKVLAHPSIACFLTHCGWNSTVEGLSNGVPFLCWPCFSDQPYNRTCICHAWKIGISLIPDKDDEIILANEVKEKINELLSSADLIENSLKLKEIAQKSVKEGGSSFAAMRRFIGQTLC